MGYSTRAGWRVNLKYDYIHQDQLRHGTGTASAVPIGNELEHKTTSHYVTAGVTYAPNRKWMSVCSFPMSFAIIRPTESTTRLCRCNRHRHTFWATCNRGSDPSFR